MENELFFTLSEVAARLCITRRTLYRWIDEGCAPAVSQVGPRRRGVLASDLRAFMASRPRVGVAAPKPKKAAA